MTSINILAGAFDTSTALSGMFLWVIFGYLTALVNCDLQRFLRTHPLALHAVGIVAFFFLFTIIDNKGGYSIGVVWAKTLIVYALFVMMTKSKWFFVVPVLCLLLLDQSFKKHLASKEEQKTATEGDRAWVKRATVVINILILILIPLGTLHYMALQYLEYRRDFSFYKFFLGFTQCKEVAPNYNLRKLLKK